MTEQEFLLLPEDDNVLVLRRDAWEYGFPSSQTFARWATYPSTAPCELPYTFIGRLTAYRVGTLRELRRALTYRNTTARTAARIARLEREVGAGAEAS